MNAIDNRLMASAQHQMPTLYAKHLDTVREYAHHSGGGCINLQRTCDEATGAHVTLVQDGPTFYVWIYSDDGERCEGHEINVTDSDSNAIWWFLNAATSAPCPCVADNA